MVRAVEYLDSSISEPLMIAKLVQLIDRLALIKVEHTARQIVVHRVVQTVVRERMTVEQLQAAQRDAHELRAQIRPRTGVDDPQTWPKYRQIWPHLRPAEVEQSVKEQVRELLLDRVRYLRLRDDLEPGNRRALTVERTWLAMLAEQPGPEIARPLRKQLNRMQFHRANLLRDLGQFDQSRALDEAVLARQSEELSDEHPHTLQTRGSLAADLRALGEYQQALEFDRDTYNAWAVTSGFGDDNAGTLSAANNLALSSLLNGDFRDALRRDRLTLARRLELYGLPAHQNVLSSRTAIGRDLIEAGRYREAVTILTENVDLAQRALGDGRITLNARLWLGIAQRCAGDPERAAENIDAAVSGLIRRFGPDSNDALAARLNRALTQLALGKVSSGRAALDEILAAYQARLGPIHPNTLVCQLDLGTALCLEENYAVALPHIESALDGLTERLGWSHPHTLAATLMKGSVLACLDRPREAALAEKVVLEERTRVFGLQHPDTLRCQVNLMLSLEQMGMSDQAAERQHIIAELVDQIGAEHPDITAISANRRLFSRVIPQPF